ncbi:hypothetical protein QC761_0048200 [Podospora bellae-mahoneyi]|uniref:Protein kinase domain-containing protein n=1 Tax=Podospora bellae-mahoneyi TaxID=2093777 RepID=A0ABR0FJ72_9PEZI|nr:hypothetical protein QC761_0048200 [Podospora bellae-mahoneyi]
MSSDQSFEVVESSEVFVEEADGWVFHSTKLIIKQVGQYFSARIPTRLASIATIDLDSISMTAIPTNNIWPPFEPGITIISEPLTAEHFYKRPSLLQYGDTEASLNPGRELLKEAKICEILRQRPHPNIATYLGSVVEDNRIKGLVFRKYAMTLSQRLRVPRLLDGERCLRAIEDGLLHLHSLGLIHNDLNPSNIMFDNDDNVVIIDFDSCEKQGAALGPKTYTPGWSPKSRSAEENNDYFNLSKLRDLITGAGLVTRAGDQGLEQ